MIAFSPVNRTCRGSARARRVTFIAFLLALALACGPGIVPGTVSRVAAQRAPDVSGELFGQLALRGIGPANMSGRVVDLAVFESDPTLFYVATATGGLWKTDNNGVTFTCVFEREAVHSIGAVTLCQTNPDLIWVGTGERANRQSSGWGNGVYRSTDGGRSWHNLGLRDSRHIGRIAIDPTDSDIVFVAAMGHLWGPNAERGLYRTTDGGRSWEQVLFIDDDTGVVDVAIDPDDPSIVYAATYQRRRRTFGFHGGGPGSGLWKSTDSGRNWCELTRGLPEGDKGRIGISIYRRDPRIVYVCVEQGWRYNASTAYGERRAGVYRSEDRGENFTHMSDWNPRPMYASQIYVDPNDDRRVYMQNSFSVSTDAGQTFHSISNSLHGDDRIVWVDPADSRHLIKGDDGGLGISWDRAESFLYLPHLPVSQFYRVGVDYAEPFNIYGGLQDNGSWYGPSATYRREGILNEDWIRTGGGDGFFNVPDPADERTLYTESQYLMLSRRDLVTGESQSIRPGDPHGAIGARRNWDAWGPGLPEPELGNAMAPANWDGPFILSPHDPQTVYAGTDTLWRSTDRGRTWTSLGDMTTGTNRRELLIMGQRPHDETLSLDDGIPYWPTITAIEESPDVRGLLYVGTDDGNLQVSADNGQTWTNVADRFPGLPGPRWVSDIEASHYRVGVVYAAFDGHRSDDNGNYLYRSEDRGQNWRSITGDLPPERVVRAVHEDPRNPEVLWLGTEFGCFVTLDGGGHWVELKNNLPTVAVNDLLVHPRDNDLVLGTHGRGIWILDNVNALQELTPGVVASPVHLFTIEPAVMIRLQSEKAHSGDMIFRGPNPPAGAIIDFWLSADDPADFSLEVLDAAGQWVADVRVRSPRRGINRAVWNLRCSPFYAGPGRERAERSGTSFLITPGEYTVRLQGGGTVCEQILEVSEDPRIPATTTERRAWTQKLLSLGDLIRDCGVLVQEINEAAPLAEALRESRRNRELKTEAAELQRMGRELSSRIRRLASEISGWTGLPTTDQLNEEEYFRAMVDTLRERLEALRERLGEAVKPRPGLSAPDPPHLPVGLRDCGRGSERELRQFVTQSSEAREYGHNM